MSFPVRPMPNQCPDEESPNGPLPVNDLHEYKRRYLEFLREQIALPEDQRRIVIDSGSSIKEWEDWDPDDE